MRDAKVFQNGFGSKLSGWRIGNDNGNREAKDPGLSLKQNGEAALMKLVLNGGGNTYKLLNDLKGRGAFGKIKIMGSRPYSEFVDGREIVKSL